ncbi:MAG: family 20 glycosylhydrolase [Cytophagaceae bacterium]
MIKKIAITGLSGLIFLLISLELIFAPNEFEHPAADQIFLEWRLDGNNHLGHNIYKSALILKNQSNKKLNRNWQLFFNNSICRKIITDSLPEGIEITRINGDFYKISPTSKFPTLKPGESYSIPLFGSDHVIKYSDAPSGFYFVFFNKEGIAAKPEAVRNYAITPFEKKEQITRGPEDKYAFPDALSRYKSNESLIKLGKSQLLPIIPTPLNFQYTNGDALILTETFQIRHDKEFHQEAQLLKEYLITHFNLSLPCIEGPSDSKQQISLEKGNINFSKSDEAYTLLINTNGVKITGNTAHGIFNGIQSFKSLIPADYYIQKLKLLSLPAISIEDAPSFEYRGLLIDVARHFQSKKSILKSIDLISLYKINKLHLHLTDDEGWRIEINDLPELTDIASKRGHSKDESQHLIPAYGSGPYGELSPSNGYYSKEDFIEILKYAKSRHIEIIPEIDLPGHARAAIVAMKARSKKFTEKGDNTNALKYLLHDPEDKSEYLSVQQYNDNVICPCNEGIYNFINKVVFEIKVLYNEAGVTFTTIHIGGDEVPHGAWEKSPSCLSLKKENRQIKNADDIRNNFLKRTTAILQQHDLTVSVYEDALLYNAGGKLEIREEYLKKKYQAYAWNNVWGWGTEDIAYRLANKGYPVVLTHVTNLYFDHAYSNDPADAGLYWGGFNDTRKAYEYIPFHLYKSAYKDRMGNKISESIFSGKEKLNTEARKNIKGMMGMLFSETIKSEQMLEEYIFPKIIGLAERAWAKEPDWAYINNSEERTKILNAQWNVFANTIGQKELPKLDYISGGSHYHLPAPGLIMEDGQIKANSPFPGLAIRYTTDGKEPNQTSKLYYGPFKASGMLKFALVTNTGRTGRVSVINTEVP